MKDVVGLECDLVEGVLEDGGNGGRYFLDPREGDVDLLEVVVDLVLGAVDADCLCGVEGEGVLLLDLLVDHDAAEAADALAVEDS